MTRPGEEEETVPAGPGRPLAVASALVIGAALAAAAGRPAPLPPEVERGGAAGEEPPAPAGPPPGTKVMAAIVAGLRSPDPVERRETAGVVERLAREGDPASRRALAAALADMGGPEARLPLGLLAADGDRRVRIEARRGLLDGEGRGR